MENSSRNHPSLPSNYVTILDLKEQWLKQQQQQQQQQRDDVKYVTILDLKERWLKQQQEDDIKKTANSNEFTENSVDDEISAKKKLKFRNSGKLKSSGNPNLNRETERGFWRNPNRNNRRQNRRVLDGEEKSTTTKQYRPVNVSNLTAETQEINAEIKIDDEKKTKKKAKKKRSKDKRRRKIGENEEDVSKITESKTGDFGVNDDQTAEIEAKMKEVVVAEKTTENRGNVVHKKRNPMAAKSVNRGNVVHEKRNLLTTKRVYEPETRNVWGSRGGYQSLGRRSFYGGEGDSNSISNNNSTKGLVWVKKGEVLGKSNNCTEVEDANVD